MGKGDQKSKRGKIIRGSYGVRRSKKTHKPAVVAAPEAMTPPTVVKGKAAKAAAPAAKAKAAKPASGASKTTRTASKKKEE